MIQTLPALPTNDLLLVGLLGEGGSARVYRAWHVLGPGGEGGQWVAVKVLRADASARARERFEAEARLLSSLTHRNLLKALRVGTGEPPYFVLEIADGGSLRDWCERHGAMAPRIAVDAMIQICKAVAVAHKAGVVHCDIKPHNILVNRRGICKLTDFGAARPLQVPLDPGRPSLDEGDTDRVGTLGYMAPEQQSDPGAIGVRTDVYGLAATLFHLLAGKPPPPNLFMAGREYPETFAGLPEAIVPILLKATSFRPADRHESAMELARALDATWEFLPPGGAEVSLLKGIPQEPAPPAGMAARTPASVPPASAVGPAAREPGRETVRPSIPPPSLPPGRFSAPPPPERRAATPAGATDAPLLRASAPGAPVSAEGAAPPAPEVEAPTVEGASVDPVPDPRDKLRRISADPPTYVEPISRTRWALVLLGAVAIGLGLLAADVSWVASARRTAEHANVGFADLARRHVSVMDELESLGAERAALEPTYRGIRDRETAAERLASGAEWVAALHAALPPEGEARTRRVVADRLSELDAGLAGWSADHERWAHRVARPPGSWVSGLVGSPGTAAGRGR